MEAVDGVERVGRAPCSVGDFVARVEELGGSFMVEWRRPFAPGSHGPRLVATQIWAPPSHAPEGAAVRGLAVVAGIATAEGLQLWASPVPL